jgi:Ca2+-transporting ATPase
VQKKNTKSNATDNKSINWYSLSVEESLNKSGSSNEGLNEDVVASKLEEFGKNELVAKKNAHPLIIFFKQFIDVMVLVLVVAAIISAFIGEASDTIVIIIILVLNAVIGFVQEYRAEKAMEALRKMATPVSFVIRSGKTKQLPLAEIVPGDIVLLEAGNSVPADMRLIVSEGLKINEASLTGESVPVDKITDAINENDLSLGDQLNMTFKGTQVTNGIGRGVVIATGMKTELGKIAGMLETADSQTPLQTRLISFSRKLTVIIIGMCLVFFIVGYLRGEELEKMLLTSISLAVAAIPEALPAVVTISLALGARRLAKQNVLIRKLYAVETLGSVTYICTDKTGTLTKNLMTVEEIWAPDENRKGQLLQAMSLNHDIKDDDGKPTGDPTELAMVEYAKEQPHYERVKQIPFDSDRKAMTTIHKKDGSYWVITKGAAEVIHEISNAGTIQEVFVQSERMSEGGMRVLGFAGKQLDSLPNEINADTIEKDLEFIGLAGLIDPPREEAKKAIGECKTAGIIPVMITGDHPLTAAAIAKQIGIIENESHLVMAGKEMREMEKLKLQEMVEKIRVYARVSPEQKLNIVEALQAKTHFVSMTGDGVNDAPSLKQANIGIAMGITGTDVTKEAAHMILLDDNFATIVKAVREGRRVYDNIRKFIRYILTGNVAEIATIFIAPLIGLPIPLLPVHILWVNLVTDGLPALALAAEVSEKGIMKRPPRKTNESIFSHGLGIHVLWVGIFISILCLGVQWFTVGDNNTHWQTMVFTVICFCQLFHVTAIRSEERFFFQIKLFSNLSLLLAVLGTVGLQLLVIYLPVFNKFFHTQPLTFSELLIATGIASLTFVAVEAEKGVKKLLKK